MRTSLPRISRIESLRRMYAERVDDSGFFDLLISKCFSDSESQRDTTWLVKHHYASGKTLPEFQVNKLLGICENVAQWETAVHILQLLSKFKLTEHTIILVEDFVRKSLIHPNKFVRAWAFQGMYELSKYMPGLTGELYALCEKALETEGAAVKARVRKVLLCLKKGQVEKKGGKNIGVTE